MKENKTCSECGLLPKCDTFPKCPLQDNSFLTKLNAIIFSMNNLCKDFSTNDATFFSQSMESIRKLFIDVNQLCTELERQNVQMTEANTRAIRLLNAQIASRDKLIYGLEAELRE